jgi:hypothetical protein
VGQNQFPAYRFSLPYPKQGIKRRRSEWVLLAHGKEFISPDRKLVPNLGLLEPWLPLKGHRRPDVPFSIGFATLKNRQKTAPVNHLFGPR